MIGKELEFILRLAELPGHPRLRMGIGDDMAAIATPGGIVLVASDMLLDGVHFDSRMHPPEMIGRKAVACNLSDCAAMAVQPVAITISLALPSGWAVEDSLALVRGAAGMAEAFDVALAGGDTTSWAHPLAVDVAVTAVPYPGIAPVLRRGAAVGDKLYVTGPLGGSIRGRHMRFTPRVAESHAIAEQLGARLHAMMDISDGLALDLSRLCVASGVGARLRERSISGVIHDDAVALSAEDGVAAMAHALHDGEDFELLLAVDGPADVTGVQLLEVGQITKEGLEIEMSDGSIRPLAPLGYTHL